MNNKEMEIDNSSLFKTAVIRRFNGRYNREDIANIKLNKGFEEYHATEADLEFYHKISPLIIAGLEELPKAERDLEYYQIYYDYMDEAAEAIAIGAYDYARFVYRCCLETFGSKYAKPIIAENIVRTLRLKREQNKKTNE